MCMCVSTGVNLDGLKAEDKFCVYACMHDNKSDLNRNSYYLLMISERVSYSRINVFLTKPLMFQNKQVKVV